MIAMAVTVKVLAARSNHFFWLAVIKREWGIANAGQVLGSRLEVQLTQHAVAAGVILRFLETDRFLVGNVAKLDRTGWASRLAGGDDVAIVDAGVHLPCGQ